MAEQKIIVTIKAGGQGFAVETEGYEGKGCDAVHEAFEQMGDRLDTERKPEYYKNTQNQNRVTSGR